MAAFYERFAGSNAAAAAIFLLIFLVTVGGALLLTPRIAKWVDERRKRSPGFYDGMLEQDPNAHDPAEAEEAAEDGTEEGTEDGHV